MSQFHCFLMLLVFVIFVSTNIHKTTATSSPYSENHKTFVKTWCNSTTYPDICYKSLSSHSSTIKSDPIELCTTALKLNMKSAKEATKVVSKLLKISQKSIGGRKIKVFPERRILKDCLEGMKDTIIDLKEAITEMKTLRDGGDSVAEHIFNVKIAVSSALTDEDICMDGFEEAKVNGETKKKVTTIVEELTTTTIITLRLITNLSNQLN